MTSYPKQFNNSVIKQFDSLTIQQYSNSTMNIKICTPVIGKTLEEFLFNLEKTQNISDLVELRVDYISNLSLKDIEIIKSNTNKASIFTCRSRTEGGYFNGFEDNRIHILQSAIGVFDYVDIELATIEHHQFNRNDKTKLIISYHDFKETPSYWDMQSIILKMNSFKPDILKIATHVAHDYEVGKIYRLLTNKPKNENRIVIGMGETGKMTRILGPLLGSYLTYAATSWGESAPGQLMFSKMKQIYENMSS